MARLLIEKSILKTLAYGDVFGWPVREDEIFTKVQGPRSKVQGYNLKLKTNLKKLLKEKKIEYKNGFYFLPGREENVEKRLQREKMGYKEDAACQKIQRKRLKINFFRILLVGVSGRVVCW